MDTRPGMLVTMCLCAFTLSFLPRLHPVVQTIDCHPPCLESHIARQNFWNAADRSLEHGAGSFHRTRDTLFSMSTLSGI